MASESDDRDVEAVDSVASGWASVEDLPCASEADGSDEALDESDFGFPEVVRMIG